MANDQQDAFLEKLFVEFGRVKTVGEYKSLVALATGVSVDDLGIADTIGAYVYELPDFVSVPLDPYVFLKRKGQ